MVDELETGKRVARRRGYRTVADEELKRNTLSIRFDDETYKTLTDCAWRNRQSVSGLVREIILDDLNRRGVIDGIK